MNREIKVGDYIRHRNRPVCGKVIEVCDEDVKIDMSGLICTIPKNKAIHMDHPDPDDMRFTESKRSKCKKNININIDSNAVTIAAVFAFIYLMARLYLYYIT